MSRVSEIRTQLETIVQGVLPTYTLLSDGIDSKDNAIQLLNKGFAIGYGSSEGNYDEWCMGQMRQRREFRIILTNIYVPGTRADYRVGLETSLMEDEFLVIGAITSNVTLTGYAINTQFATDQGIQYLTDETSGKQFITIIMAIIVDYIEGV